MEKRYYTVASIERILRIFEHGYGLPSEAFYRSHANDGDNIAHVSFVHR